MQELVGDLLEYSRIGNQSFGLIDMDSKQQTEHALSNLEEMIEDTEAVIHIGNLPVIYTHPVRFSRSMQNLIGNALKYKVADRAPVVSIDMLNQDTHWLFSVSDNGIGIRENYLEQIFVIFKRLHGKKEYKGTGIGLAVCKKIVENFEGRIWAESVYGEESTFFFTIPKKNDA